VPRSSAQQQQQLASSAAAASTSSLEALCGLRATCCDVLAALHPSNLPFLADLFTSCVLQVGGRGPASLAQSGAVLRTRAGGAGRQQQAEGGREGPTLHDMA
jgi:hypothetical protein